MQRLITESWIEHSHGTDQPVHLAGFWISTETHQGLEIPLSALRCAVIHVDDYLPDLGREIARWSSA